MIPNDATIFVVDDDANNQFIITTLLKKEGYKTASALNGEDALEGIPKICPDLILLDIMMPKLSGHEVAQALKKNPKTADIPILFISTLNDTKNILMSFEYGGVDFITKPFRKPEVLARIKTHLELKNLRKRAELHALEMEQFAYMAAYDLKAPSLAMKNLAQHMLDGSSLDNEELSYRISRSSAKLCSLVDNLLQLSEGNKKTIFKKHLSLKGLIDEILQENKTQLKAVNARVNLTLLSTVYSEADTLKILLKHLISNCIKYSDPKRPLQLDISTTEDENYQRITVKDNGAGFHLDKNNNPFQAFTRFHGINIDGHGLGLTICKKIVECHKGKIEISSDLDKGTTVIIALPKS